MVAVLRHLRVLCLPMDQHHLLTKYLLPEEKTFLMTQFYLKEKSSSGHAAPPPSLNVSTAPRRKPAFHFSNTLELIPDHLIVKDGTKLIEQDLDTVDWESKFVCIIEAWQDLTLKGVEMLTRACQFPEPSCSKDSKKARYSLNNIFCTTVLFLITCFFIRIDLDDGDIEYYENLKLRVWGCNKWCGWTILFRMLIQGKRKYNSWFYSSFDNDIFIPGGTTCTIEVCPQDEATYQTISETEVKKFLRFSKWHARKEELVDGVWERCNQQNYIIKSVSLVPRES